MMRPRFAALALAAVAAWAPVRPAPAAAPVDDGPRYIRSLKKGFEIARERGWAILVWSTMDTEQVCKADVEIFKKPEVQSAMKGFLVLFANNEDIHGSKSGTIDGKPAKICNLVPTIECADHKAAQDDVYRTYADISVNKAANLCCPNHFVVDPEGKVIAQINNGTKESGFDGVLAPKMVEGLKAALAKAGGPGLSDEEYARGQKALASARASVDQKRMSEAARALAPLVASGKKIALLQDARDLLARIDKEASPALAKAQADLKTDPLAGIAGLDRVVEEYPGTESAAAAKKAGDAFRASPEGKKVLKDLAREKEGSAEIRKAEEIAGGGKDDAKYLRLLDGIVKKYAGLPCAAAAKAKADAVREDPERAKALAAAEAEREAKSALVAARGLLDSGKKDEARKALQALVEKFAGTKVAEEAKTLLEGIR